MSLFEPDLPPEVEAEVDVPVVSVRHWAKDQRLVPMCGGTGHVTVMGSLVTCEACRAKQQAGRTVRVARPVWGRDGLCQACSVRAVDGGEFCEHHQAIWDTSGRAAADTVVK